MTVVHRVLAPEPVVSLDDHVRRRGGRGLQNAREVEPEALIDEIEASGLRGRGGAGFPTHVKWRTIRENRSSDVPATVVVNAAEGEPGTFKDRMILERDPYSVIEGALIAALAVGADRVVIGTKASFGSTVSRVASAIAEVEAARWAPDVELSVAEGPDEYLFGEETALLEVLEGRPPLPRLAPPFRRGADEVAADDATLDASSGVAAQVEMAGPGDVTGAPPALVSNVETFANVPGIIARGASWFRTMGTPESPGTVVCTVTGSVRRPGVAEVIMGTPLREVLDEVGGGAVGGRRIVAVLPGVSNPLLVEDDLDAPVSYEGMAAAGSGLGSAGFIVLDDSDDPLSVVAGVSRFLAVESCGQCTPCKQGGLAISGLLDRLCHNDAGEPELARLGAEVASVADGARCYLASQHEVVVTSLVERFGSVLEAHAAGSADAVEPAIVAELTDLTGGVATIDLRHATKQPDWTFDPVDSGQSPADRLGEHRDDTNLP